MPALIPTDVQAWIQERGALLADPVIDIIAILVLTGLVLMVWAIRRQRRVLREQEARNRSVSAESTEAPR